MVVEQAVQDDAVEPCFQRHPRASEIRPAILGLEKCGLKNVLRVAAGGEHLGRPPAREDQELLTLFLAEFLESLDSGWFGIVGRGHNDHSWQDPAGSASLVINRQREGNVTRISVREELSR